MPRCHGGASPVSVIWPPAGRAAAPLTLLAAEPPSAPEPLELLDRSPVRGYPGSFGELT
ncbi:hypothetical protein H7H51_02085 [Mycolicibacterium farcinogenes]|nr:hypothetical protein [Mycolicibacterium farcinogenes]